MTKKEIEKVEQVMTRFEKRYWNAKQDLSAGKFHELAHIADMMDGMSTILRALGYEVISGFSATNGAYVKIEKGAKQ